MELYDALLTTRAMRRYSDAPVTDDGGRALPQGRAAGAERREPAAVAVPGRHRSGAAGRARRALPRRLRPLRAHAPRRHAALPVAGRRDVVGRAARPRRDISPITSARRPPSCCSSSRSSTGRRVTRKARWTSVHCTRRCIPRSRTSCSPARDLGIGTALTTVVRIRQDDVRVLLGIPEAMEVAAVVPMGRPTGRFGSLGASR